MPDGEVIVLTNSPDGRIVRHRINGWFTNNVPFVVPPIRLETTISTNWLPITLQSPNGDGSTLNVEKEIGVLVSNRYAKVVADKTTNRILLSSKVHYPKEELVRDAPRRNIFFYTHTLTNSLTNIFWNK